MRAFFIGAAMTGTIATIPKYQFLDSLGVPLVNGTLTTYLTGTTTLTSTWQDQALSSLNTNPIVLDARGEATLWLDSALVYKFVLANEAGAIQWTQENISGTNSGASILRADLVSSSGASFVGFIQSGTGAVARTSLSKLRESVSFADFGCVGDGSDEYVKLQAALTYASASGKSISDFSGNTYNYGTTLSVGAIEMFGNFTLNGTGSAFVDVSGTLIEVGHISSAVNAGANTITLSSVAGLAANDLLILWNSVASSYSIHRTNYYDGEFIRVAGVSGSNVTSQSNILTSYSGVSTSKVFKSSGIRVVIDGPSFTGSGVYGLRIRYADNVELNPTLVQISTYQAALSINKCYNVKVSGGRYYTPYDASGGCYGISVSNSQDINIHGIDAYGGRHAVTTGGDAENGSVPCRFVYVEDSVLTNDPVSAVYCADFHGNTLDSHYKNCTIYGRIGLAGERVSCIDSTVYSWPSSVYPPLGYHEVVGGRIVFKNNIVIVGEGSTAFAIVDNLSSSLTAKITKTYNIVVDGLEATINSSVTKLVSAFENSGQPNAWIVKDFGVRGNISGLTTILDFVLVGPGVDASYIEITEPRFNTEAYTIVGETGTTLASCRFQQPSFVGSDANGSWTKFPDGTMICRNYLTPTTALDTAFLGGFRSGTLTWTYPKTFIAAPEVSITPANGSATSSTISSKTTSSCVFFGIAISTQVSAARAFSMIAVGRWY